MGNNPLEGLRIGFVGAGNMAEALARGLLASGAIPASSVVAYDPSTDRAGIFRGLGAALAASNAEVAERCDVIILAVKPQVAPAACASLKPGLAGKSRLAISIMAGITTARIGEMLGAGVRVVRAMPNTPMLIRCGATCICPGAGASEKDMAVAEAIFVPASMVMRVPESLMDGATALSGSGPAYAFYLVEAMVEAGVAEGFRREDALGLATRAVLGAARMLEETGLAPGELRRRVTSPGGTTQAAIESMEAAGVRGAISAAVRRAAARARELAGG
ncbi:MAG: pyrroline-5-carboxylate reductase [Planctomycetota bacterium]|nr:pyrroline-5-carboxylate reductase [Planctomycetota bacterium]